MKMHYAFARESDFTLYFTEHRKWNKQSIVVSVRDILPRQGASRDSGSIS